MKYVIKLLLLSLLMGAPVGCVTKHDVALDAQLRTEAMQAYDACDFQKVKRLIARADKLRVPQSKLWRRTLSLRVAIAEDTQLGELREFLRVWGEQRSDWSMEDKISAELTLAEVLKPAYAANWLYDLDPTAWPAELRTRHHLLLSQLELDDPNSRDDATARWLKGIHGMYKRGDTLMAANQAMQCATKLKSANAALIAAKLYNELYNESRKNEALKLVESLTTDVATLQEVKLIRSAPLGTRSTL